MKLTKLIKFKIADMLAEQMIEDNYWDLFTEEQKEELWPMGRLANANHIFKPALAKILKR